MATLTKIKYSFFCFFLVLLSCSEEKGITTQETKNILQKIANQAHADSITISKTKLKALGKILFVINQENKKVTLEDNFELSKNVGTSYITTPKEQIVKGDSVLLKDMYTFKDSKDRPREMRNTELSGLSFGAEITTLVRDLLFNEKSFATIKDSLAQNTNLILIDYSNENSNGKIIVDKQTNRAITLIQNSSRNYFFGSYDSRMKTEYKLFNDSLLLPTNTHNSFDYRRIFTKGHGELNASLNIIE